MKNIKEMNGNEKIAFENIKHAINWVVGGYANSLMDGIIEDLPDSQEDLFDEIYDAAITDKYGPGSVSFNRAPKEMRFAGRKFIEEAIMNELKNDPDIAEMKEAANWV